MGSVVLLWEHCWSAIKRRCRRIVLEKEHCSREAHRSWASLLVYKYIYHDLTYIHTYYGYLALFNFT